MKTEVCWTQFHTPILMLNSLRCGVGNKAVAAEEFYIQQRQILMLDTLIRACIDIKCGIEALHSLRATYNGQPLLNTHTHAKAHTCDGIHKVKFLYSQEF